MLKERRVGDVRAGYKIGEFDSDVIDYSESPFFRYRKEDAGYIEKMIEDYGDEPSVRHASTYIQVTYIFDGNQYFEIWVSGMQGSRADYKLVVQETKLDKRYAKRSVSAKGALDGIESQVEKILEGWVDDIFVTSGDNGGYLDKWGTSTVPSSDGRGAIVRVRWFFDMYVDENGDYTDETLNRIERVSYNLPKDVWDFGNVIDDDFTTKGWAVAALGKLRVECDGYTVALHEDDYPRCYFNFAFGIYPDE